MQGQKIAFASDKATVPEYDDIKTENGKLMAYLREKGFEPSCQVWDNDKVNWADFDAVIIKTPWDYHNRILEFQAWLVKLEKVGAYVLNPVPTIPLDQKLASYRKTIHQFPHLHQHSQSFMVFLTIRITSVGDLRCLDQCINRSIPLT